MTLNELIADITLHPEKIDSLLEVLHHKARDYDQEHGLPIYGVENDSLRLAVIQWLFSLTEGAK